ncbi:Uncharacterised protein [Mycobacteroides abscessus]|nr:Uncharacterised protein [Mycobacteroides abscessus]
MILRTLGPSANSRIRAVPSTTGESAVSFPRTSQGCNATAGLRRTRFTLYAPISEKK